MLLYCLLFPLSFFFPFGILRFFFSFFFLKKIWGKAAGARKVGYALRRETGLVWSKKIGYILIRFSVDLRMGLSILPVRDKIIRQFMYQDNKESCGFCDKLSIA